MNNNLWRNRTKLRPFTTADQTAVRDLILAGLGQRFGHIDPSYNPDLRDIQATYIEQQATVLVLEDEHQTIIGCGALTVEDAQKNIGRIERVSVHLAHQKQGIGSFLVQALLEVAAQRNMPKIVVETNDDWHDAIALYQKFGFTQYGHHDGEVHMTLEI